MRPFLPFLGLLWLVLLSKNTAAEQVQSRPAVLIQGKSSLVNLIDQDALVKRGQGNAMVFFTAVVSEGGHTREYFTRVYGGTPNSEALTREIIGKIDRSFFHPAL